ncbi:MAG TPA: hypothetical protein VM489_00030, partial [Burkholderiales bacterium]|nr:hypothetical protein [Burkholderiales bacterium]
MLKDLLKNLRKDDLPVSGTPSAPDVAPEAERAFRDRILAAQGDEEALLRAAHEAPTVDLKAAAIEALSQEDSFRRAMRELGEGDKRLYRLARAGWQAASGRRKAAAQAQELIAAGRALLDRESVPINRVVELDQA